MELLKDRIKEFLKVDTGYGSGSGSGSGYGDGSGSGYGDGSGSGYGSGYVDGYGYGYGSGSGYGYGYGYGDGSGIKKINKYNVYNIDDVQTIILSIYKNIAKGKILNKDMTLTDCYIAKGQNMFAHGDTIEKAVEDLRNKIFDNLDVEEKIEEFKKIFEKDKKYKGTEFYKWHHFLTGSCEMGRNSFVKNHSLNLEDKFTVNEFIEICENDYGGSIIKQLKKIYKGDK